MPKELEVKQGNLVKLRDGKTCIVIEFIPIVVNEYEGTTYKSTYPIRLSNTFTYTSCGELKKDTVDSRDIVEVLEVSDGYEVQHEEKRYVFYNNIGYVEERYNNKGRIHYES